MRTTFLVCYDITDDKRLRRVFKTCKNYGDHLQYSVFECDLNPAEKVELERALSDLCESARFLAIHELSTDAVACRMSILYMKLDALCLFHEFEVVPFEQKPEPSRPDGPRGTDECLECPEEQP